MFAMKLGKIKTYKDTKMYNFKCILIRAAFPNL